MTPEQERAEARINKTKIIAWLKHMIEGNEFAEADGESSAYKFTLGRIEDGKFDINSLDREEQLIAEMTLWRDKFHQLTDVVAEHDKEIQRVKASLIVATNELRWNAKSFDTIEGRRAIKALDTISKIIL